MVKQIEKTPLLKKGVSDERNSCKVKKIATLRLVDYSFTYMKIIKKDYALILWKILKPRAGFAPAACCLRGSRSTGLSYRGTIDANNTEPIFKVSQTPTLKAINDP